VNYIILSCVTGNLKLLVNIGCENEFSGFSSIWMCSVETTCRVS